MKRLLILCEGHTEETFINKILAPHLASKGVGASCTMITTSREQGRRAHRGGHTNRYERIRRDLTLLLQSKPDALTTMIDLYAFPRDMPGFPNPWPSDTRQRFEALAAAFAKDVKDPRFIPGLIVHEFEGLLFTAPEAIARIAVPEEHARGQVQRELQRIARSFATPEDINDSPQTAPSKRLEGLIPTYKKPRHGPLIAEQIGLELLRQHCPIFAEWLTRLEAVGAQ